MWIINGIEHLLKKKKNLISKERQTVLFAMPALEKPLRLIIKYCFCTPRKKKLQIANLGNIMLTGNCANMCPKTFYSIKPSKKKNMFITIIKIQTEKKERKQHLGQKQKCLQKSKKIYFKRLFKG